MRSTIRFARALAWRLADPYVLPPHLLAAAPPSCCSSAERISPRCIEASSLRAALSQMLGEVVHVRATSSCLHVGERAVPRPRRPLARRRGRGRGRPCSRRFSCLGASRERGTNLNLCETGQPVVELLLHIRARFLRLACLPSSLPIRGARSPAPLRHQYVAALRRTSRKRAKRK